MWKTIYFFFTSALGRRCVLLRGRCVTSNVNLLLARMRERHSVYSLSAGWDYIASCHSVSLEYLVAMRSTFTSTLSWFFVFCLLESFLLRQLQYQLTPKKNLIMSLMNQENKHFRYIMFI